MQLSPLGLATLREYSKRHPAPLTVDDLSTRTATDIRSWFHPKQRAFFARVRGVERPRWRALLKTRRVGATAGGVRELLACALEIPGFRATYVSKTGVDARDRAWTNDNKTGILDLIRELGSAVKLQRQKLESYSLGGVVVKVKDLAMKLDFTNGSQIEVFGANNVDRQSGKRGAAKHVFWIDEAQDFPSLDEFIAVLSAAMRDFGGECWLTGTPGRDCAGLFYEVTKDESDGDERPEGWDVHHIAVIDNPFFGTVVKDRTGKDQWWVEDNLFNDRRLTFNERLRHRKGPFNDPNEAERVAAELRWEVTAGAEMKEKGLKGDEPDFIREWLGRWVKADAAFVYPVHAVPKQRLIFAPQRLAPNPLVGTDPRFDGHPPWYDHHAAVRDLPRTDANNRPHKWLYSLWFDFGFWPDPFAAVLWAFTPTLHDVYEMFSWKQTRVHADDQRRYIKLLWEMEPSIVSFGGDAAGKQADFAEWHRRFNLPLEEANKQGKNTLEEMLAGDIRRGFVHFRDGSPLVTEMRFLVYLPTAPGKPRQVHKHRSVGGVVHGDHCCLVAQTMVETDLGRVAIENVRPGDLAWTRDALRPVTASFSVGIRPTWRADLDNGESLTGTADHPVWTDRGWIPLAQLTPGDTLTGWGNTDQHRPSSSTGVDTGATRSPSTGRQGSTSCARSNATAEAIQNRSTAPSGNITTGMSPMDSMSIIATRTRSTTSQATSSSYPATNTYESTPSHPNELPSLARTSPRPRPQHRNGTGRQLDGNGIASMGSGRWSVDHCSPWDASDAAASSRASSPPRGSVATPARQPTDETAASTTSSRHVENASRRSVAADIATRNAAPAHVLRVEETGRSERVYNLTVAGEHEYYANGVLVSNCDASRYGFAALTHYLSKVPDARPPAGTRAAYQLEEAQIEQQLDDHEARRQEHLADADEVAEEYGNGGYDGYQY